MDGYVRIREIGKGAMGCASLVERKADRQKVTSAGDRKGRMGSAVRHASTVVCCSW